MKWWVLVLIASCGSAAAAEAGVPIPAKPSPTGKAAKRPPKAAKPPVPPVPAPKPLHLGLHGLSLKRHPSEWRLESVPVPGLNPPSNPSGLRALAVVGAPAEGQRIEFGVAPMVPLRLPSSPVSGPDGVEAARQTQKSLLPAPQLYMRYSW